jgi:hypothetical protein
MIFARTLVCSFIAWGFLQTPADAQTALRYHFKEGEKTYFDVTQIATMKLNTNGMAVEVKVTLNMDVKWEVLEISPQTGTAKVALKVDSFQIDVLSQGQAFHVDSAEPKNDEEKELKAALGQGITLEIRATGEVNKVDSADAVLRALQKLQPGGVVATKGKLYARNALHPIWLTFPAGKLTKGQTWTVPQNSTIQKDFGTIKQDGKYTYQGQSTVNGKKLELLDYQMTVTLNPDVGANVQGKVTKQESKGHVLFDEDLGRYVDGSVNQSVDMEFTDGNSGETANLTIVQDVTCKHRATPKTKGA